ncbi:hypothetical protein KL909_004303 [Ogataea angusta]|nr:hypothetical protein KL909_004303 [Ogataea angusta]KAG7830009.1 hypothetical protein KL943_005175 [Ogataea angusta]
MLGADVPLGVDESRAGLFFGNFATQKNVFQPRLARAKRVSVLPGPAELQEVDAGLVELENVADRHVERQQQQREQLVDDDHEQRGRVQGVVRAVAEHSLGKRKRRHQDVEKEQLEARHKAQKPRVVVLRHDCADVETVVVETRDAAAQQTSAAAQSAPRRPLPTAISRPARRAHTAVRWRSSCSGCTAAPPQGASRGQRQTGAPTTPEAAPQAPLRRQSAPHLPSDGPSRRCPSCTPRSNRRTGHRAGRQARRQGRCGAACGAAS